MKEFPEKPRDAMRNLRYETSFYNSIEGFTNLPQLAKAYEILLPKDVGFLISGGSSSCIISAAVMMLRPNLKHLHIYPQDYRGHRSKKRDSGFGYTKNLGGVAFIDDLIDGGATTISVINGFLSACPCDSFPKRIYAIYSRTLASSFSVLKMLGDALQAKNIGFSYIIGGRTFNYDESDPDSDWKVLSQHIPQ